MWQKSKNIYHLLKAFAANIRYGYPAKDMIVIGVTGTDGKTTTANIIYHILKEARYKVAIISTVSAVIDGKEYETGLHRSTPDAIALQSYLKKAKDKGVKYIVLEVTSHGLDQNRAYGVPIAIGVLTNITREHLDYHKTFKAYTKAKMKLFTNTKTAILNHDDDSYENIIDTVKQKTKKVVTYGMKKNSDINPEIFTFKTKLIGEYNKYNCLAAIAAACEVGVDYIHITSAIANFTPPLGRRDVVYKGSFTIIIDFAHTPNGVKQVLKTVQEEKSTDAKIIHVFGAAGERDKGKRPLMGEVSSEFADIIILTAEDPRTESVDRINADIKNGIIKHDNKSIDVHEINDRQNAISKAIELAKPGDFVVITGKGHEQSLNLGKGEIPWSDYDAVKTGLKAK